MWIYSIPSIAGLLLVFFFIKDKPPTPPSGSAGEVTDPFTVGLKKVIRNIPYILLVLAFGLGAGIVSAFLTLLQLILQDYNYDDNQAGYVGAAVIGSGILGAGLAGAFVDSTKRFQETVKVQFIAATGAAFMFVAVLKADNFALILVAAALMGFSAFGALPVALELCVECTYPVNEGTSAGFMWFSTYVLGCFLAIFVPQHLSSGIVALPVSSFPLFYSK
eukprot:m.20346 g.20346  ORF g.20346 m.20346 type:complete len:220 (+) comp31929_c0_seq1:656-1315(+)